MLLLFPVLTVWSASCKFAKYLQNSIASLLDIDETLTRENIPVTENWYVVYSTYDSIRKLCHYTNNAFGSLYGAYLASSIVAQAASLDAMLNTPDFFLKTKLIFMLAMSILVYALAADVCDKASFEIKYINDGLQMQKLQQLCFNSIVAFRWVYLKLGFPLIKIEKGYRWIS